MWHETAKAETAGCGFGCVSPIIAFEVIALRGRHLAGGEGRFTSHGGSQDPYDEW